MPSLVPANIEHRYSLFPDLRTNEKNEKRMRKSQDVPLSYSGMNESNDSQVTLEPPYCLAHQDFWRPAPYVITEALRKRHYLNSPRQTNCEGLSNALAGCILRVSLNDHSRVIRGCHRNEELSFFLCSLSTLLEFRTLFSGYELKGCLCQARRFMTSKRLRSICQCM